MRKQWLVTGLSSILAFSILMPTVNADKLSELEQEKQEIEQNRMI
ncbi:hypothetical protein [Planococcus sp. MB-3u-03]|nr:hypothetical protein [Planococcus sp. MB-3u-03]